METEKNKERILDTFVNRCIDNIIKHDLIEGVTDVKSFAEFALPLELDDDRLVEGIGQGAAMTYENLSDEEKNKLKNFSIRVHAIRDIPNGDCSRRVDNIEVWSGTLLEIVHNRIRQRLKDNQLECVYLKNLHKSMSNKSEQSSYCVYPFIKA